MSPPSASRRGPGRPAHPPASRRVVLSVRVSPDLPGLCRDLARRAGQPLGEWVEARLQEAVRAWLARAAVSGPETP